MRLPLALTTLIAALACAASAAGAAAGDPTVPEAKARALALARVGGGTVRTAELEDEGGVRVWSFDIAQPTRPGVTEVLVDASSGRIVSVRHESAQEEAREQRQDSGPAK